MEISMNTPSGLERIATLETEVREIRRSVDSSAERLRSIEDLLLQGRGAIRLVHWILAGAALLGAGWFGHTKVADILKWLGS